MQRIYKGSFGMVLQKRYGWFSVIAIVLITLGVCVPSRAQLGTGVITGIVSDSSGNALPGSSVSVTNTATNEVFQTTTNTDGSFTFPPMRPGTYRVTATHGGFAQQVADHVVVEVGGTVAVNLSLTVGSATQTITVTASVPDLNTTTAGLGIAFDQHPIGNLPVNSRSAMALAALTPGAHSPFAGDVEGQGDRGDQAYSISVSGAPPGETAVVIDGMNMQLFTRAEGDVDPTVDTLSEFKIESGTLGASYGYTAGGAINMATRSGTNEYHGSLYEYIRNNAIDADNYFTPAGSSSPEFRYNQFGGTLGGPIKHNRLFFFVNYEGYNSLKGVPTYTSVPTLQERTGDFSDLYTSAGVPIVLYDPATTAPNPSGPGQVRQPFQNNNIAGEIDPVALAYQAAFYPRPNAQPTNSYTHANNYEGLVRTIFLMHQAMGRLDYRLSQADNVFVRYWYYENITNNPDLFSSAFWRHDDMQIQNLVVGETHVFSPELINDLRVGGTLDIFNFTPGGEGQGWPQKLGMPSSVPSNELPTMTDGLPTPITTQGYKGRTRFEFADSIMKIFRKHSFSFGVDYRKNEDSTNDGNGISGLYTFAAAQTDNPQQPSGTGSQYASFLIGDVSSTSFSTWIGGTDRQNTIATFAQDNWKVTHALTLDLGVRYDYQQIPYEQNNHYSSWNPNVTDSVNGLKSAYEFAGVNGVGRNFMNENYADFGPRVGFAWNLGPGQKSVVRGGYAIYYAMQDGEGFAGNENGWTNSTAYSSPSPYQIFHLDAGIPSAPIAPLGAALGPAAYLGQGPNYTHAYAPSPIAQVANLAFEQALPGGIVVQAAAVRNFGYHFPTIAYNENSLNPQYYSMGLALQNQVANPYYGIVPASSSIGGATISQQQALLPYPYYLSINGNFDHKAYYIANLGEFQVTERDRGGLTVIAGYTIGKDIDLPIEFNSASVANNLVSLGTNPGYQNVYNLAGDRSLDISDVSQRFTASVLYELPFGKNKRFSTHNRVLDAVAGGWEFNDITIFQTGFPVAIGGASNNLATRPNFVPGVSPKLSHRTPTKWFNTAAFVNPPLYTFGNVPRTLPNVRNPGTDIWNMSLFKEFPIHESMKLSFRAESFNAFNHPNFGDPNGAFSPGSNGLNASGTFGTITSTSVDNRDWQFALKLLF